MKRQFHGAIIGLALAVYSANLTAQNATVHNGYWWKDMSESMRLGYVIGFVEGSSQTSMYWRIANKTNKAKIANAKAVQDVVDFSQIRFGQFKDGLDEFYKDFRNTSIHVDDAILHVRDEIKGSSQVSLDADLDRMRKAAAQPAYDE